MKAAPFFPPESAPVEKKQNTQKEELLLFQATERLFHSGAFPQYEWQELYLLIAITNTAELILSRGPLHEVEQYRRYVPLKNKTTMGSTPLRRLTSFINIVKAHSKGGEL